MNGLDDSDAVWVCQIRTCICTHIVNGGKTVDLKKNISSFFLFSFIFKFYLSMRYIKLVKTMIIILRTRCV